ncbi:MAG: rRNA maturation RNase YbeY [Phycisphaerales bacterium]
MGTDGEGRRVELGGEGLSALPAADRAWLAASIDALLPALGTPVARAAVEVVRDARMQALHARHMGLDSTTDVLTFAQNPPGAPVDADIAVCLDEAMRRGAGAPHGTRGELLLYALHALLHACGHDDRDEASYRRMHAEEDRILEAAGFGRLFEAGEAAP